MIHATIGLEIHFRLNTRSKLFSSTSCFFYKNLNTNIFNQNYFADVFDVAFPGSLPVINKRAVFLAVKFGISINATINAVSLFDRKHYLYLDLPKGFQLTQYKKPIIENGFLDIVLSNFLKKRVFIKQVHLEEDSGRFFKCRTLKKFIIDYNRSGLPLLEVVTEPVFNTAEEVFLFLHKLYDMLCILNIGDSQMESGSFRCDVNISLRKYFSFFKGIRVELKNINSFSYVVKAISYEIKRQKILLTKGLNILQETRYFNQKNSTTYSLRVKDNTIFYRYFNEPDLSVIVLDFTFIKKSNFYLDEFIDEKKKRFFNQYLLLPEDVKIILSFSWFADYFEIISIYTTKYNCLYKLLKQDFLFFYNNFGVKLLKPYLIAEFLNSNNLNVKDFFLFYHNEIKFCFFFSFLKVQSLINYVELNFIVQQIFIIYYKQLILYKLGRVKVNFFFLGKIKILYTNFLDNDFIISYLRNFLD